MHPPTRIIIKEEDTEDDGDLEVVEDKDHIEEA